MVNAIAVIVMIIICMAILAALPIGVVNPVTSTVNITVTDKFFGNGWMVICTDRDTYAAADGKIYAELQTGHSYTVKTSKLLISRLSEIDSIVGE